MLCSKLSLLLEVAVVANYLSLSGKAQPEQQNLVPKFFVANIQYLQYISWSDDYNTRSDIHSRQKEETRALLL